MNGRYNARSMVGSRSEARETAKASDQPNLLNLQVITMVDYYPTSLFSRNGSSYLRRNCGDDFFCAGGVTSPPFTDCYPTAPRLLCGWSDGLEWSPDCAASDASSPLCSIPLWPQDHIV